MQLRIAGYTFQDLFEPQRLAELTETFREEVRASDPDLHGRYSEYIAGHTPGGPGLSALLTDIAPHVGSFIARLFGVEGEYAAMKLRAIADAVIFSVKRDFFIRRVLKKYGAPGLVADDLTLLERETRKIMDALPGIPRTGDELEIASAVHLRPSRRNAGISFRHRARARRHLREYR